MTDGISTDGASAHVGRLRRDGEFLVRRRRPLDISAWSRVGLFRGVALAVETTDLDGAAGPLVELALRTFLFNRSARIVDVGLLHHWLEDPGDGSRAAVALRMGIGVRNLAARGIMDPMAAGLLFGAHLVVTHGAEPARGLVEARLPLARGLRWVCSRGDLDWVGLGIAEAVPRRVSPETRRPSDARRGTTAVNGLVCLLDQRLEDGRGVLEVLWRKSGPGGERATPSRPTRASVGLIR